MSMGLDGAMGMSVIPEILMQPGILHPDRPAASTPIRPTLRISTIPMGNIFVILFSIILDFVSLKNNKIIYQHTPSVNINIWTQDPLLDLRRVIYWAMLV